jgi:glutaredoxin/glutathione-dependent peroxiredoxin
MTKLTTSLILAVWGFSGFVVSFHPQHPRTRHTASSGALGPKLKTPTTSTELAGVKDFVGRFRRKKTVPKIEAPIKVGDTLPAVDVEIVTALNEDGTLESSPVTISDLLGKGRNILVGMPGAFTTTCSKEHLPGYVSAASTFRKLGVDQIAVVTTNDRYVNSAWATEMGVLHKKKAGDEEPAKAQMITMLSDGDGELVRALGLAEDM